MELRIGVIGVGGLGHLQTKTYAGMPEVVIVGAADISPEARSVFEEEFGAPAYDHYRELLQAHADELDAVTIVTPHTLHYEQAMGCMERGLHVLLEKPMVTDVGHAVDLVETAKERETVLRVGYQRHFHPAFQEIRRVIRNGRIGELHAVNCYLGQDWIELHREDWRSDPSLSGGGLLYDTGSHLLDALLWTTEGEPTSVTSLIDYAEPEVDVNAALAMRLDRGDGDLLASAGISGDGVDVDPLEGYLFWGTEGRVSYADDRIAVAEKGAVTYETEITGGTDFQALNRAKLENFIASIEGAARPAVPAEVGLQVTALTEAAYRSAEAGRAIEVQPLIDEAYAERD
jgi:predicted dehydrogenase